MAVLDVAHIREQGQDMIVVPLRAEFGRKTKSEQTLMVAQLQRNANSAGLKGTVVVVWDAGGGRMAFIAPRPWHPFFRSVSLIWVAANINRRLTM